MQNICICKITSVISLKKKKNKQKSYGNKLYIMIKLKKDLKKIKAHNILYKQTIHKQIIKTMSTKHTQRKQMKEKWNNKRKHIRVPE